MKKIIVALLLMFILASCTVSVQPQEVVVIPPTNPYETDVATFAGGCFWCTESDFEKLPGVLEVTSGYAGGKEVSPRYEEVASGATGHREAIEVRYDPSVVSYAELLDWHYRHMDPTDAEGSFVDRGFQYSPAVYYHTEEQRALAEAASKVFSEHFDKPILVANEPYTTFYVAEDYHQDFYKKSPVRYNTYRFGSGRDQFLKKQWGDNKKVIFTGVDEVSSNPPKYTRPSDEEIRSKLTEEQYYVTQEDGTERAFANKYWDNKKEGIYVDIVSGEPLFSSKYKFVSGTGWPSFTKPLEPDHLVQKDDYKLVVRRTELRSKYGDSHLGHLFNDGPEPTGLRYCINSAALEFIPVDSLEEMGYGEYLKEFE